MTWLGLTTAVAVGGALVPLARAILMLFGLVILLTVLGLI